MKAVNANFKCCLFTNFTNIFIHFTSRFIHHLFNSRRVNTSILN